MRRRYICILEFLLVIFKQNMKDAEAEDLMAKKMYPKREEFQWRPSPILCKRFDLIDPYMGKV